MKDLKALLCIVSILAMQQSVMGDINEPTEHQRRYMEHSILIGNHNSMDVEVSNDALRGLKEAFQCFIENELPRGITGVLSNDQIPNLSREEYNTVLMLLDIVVNEAHNANNTFTFRGLLEGLLNALNDKSDIDIVGNNHITDVLVYFIHELAEEENSIVPNPSARQRGFLDRIFYRFGMETRNQQIVNQSQRKHRQSKVSIKPTSGRMLPKCAIATPFSDNLKKEEEEESSSNSSPSTSGGIKENIGHFLNTTFGRQMASQQFDRDQAYDQSVSDLKLMNATNSLEVAQTAARRAEIAVKNAQINSQGAKDIKKGDSEGMIRFENGDRDENIEVEKFPTQENREAIQIANRDRDKNIEDAKSAIQEAREAIQNAKKNIDSSSQGKILLQDINEVEASIKESEDAIRAIEGWKKRFANFFKGK